ncbi:MAG: hypothetical protein AAF367_11215 [Pseudomonadota bacterium]
MSFSRTAATIAGIYTLLSVGMAWAEDYVILDSNAAGIEPGIVVDGTADVSIPAGATLVLIDPQGETRVVEGPFDGPLVAAQARSDDSFSETLDRLTTSRGQDTKVLGAVRGTLIDGGSVTE